jgi:hypothetical protein
MTHSVRLYRASGDLIEPLLSTGLASVLEKCKRNAIMRGPGNSLRWKTMARVRLAKQCRTLKLSMIFDTQSRDDYRG